MATSTGPHRDISKRAPIHANRVVAVLSKMFSLAVRWGWRTDNPVRWHRAQPRAEKRRRYLTGMEPGLTVALAAHRAPTGCEHFTIYCC